MTQKKTSNTTLTIKKREFHATLFHRSTPLPEGHESCQASCQNSYVSEGWTEKERERCDAECEGKVREEIKYTEKRICRIYIRKFLREFVVRRALGKAGLEEETR